METVLSGIRSTGNLHLGNYFGALKNFVRMQHDERCFFFIADYHSLTTHPDPGMLHVNVKSVLCEYLAAGLDPDVATIYVQSDVPQVAELSLLLSMTLRFVPQFTRRLRTVAQAQRRLGRDTGRGSVRRRLREAMRVFSIVVTWSLESGLIAADSMRGRGYGLPGRTSFSIYRFDSRDSSALAWLVFCGAYLLSGWIAGGTAFRYYPTIKAAPWTPLTISFLLVYLALVLTPVILDRKEDRQWKSLRSEI